MSTFSEWTPADAGRHIRVPVADDDKYSRGVLGVVTGSAEYPGAAVLGVEAALHTGLGMLRYLGPARASDFVLQRRPETVTAPGRVQAWLLGSGQDAAVRDPETASRLDVALHQGLPTVIDAGALDLVERSGGPTIVTPHFGELARIVDASKEQVAANPAAWAVRGAEALGVTVLLKGHSTYVAAPDGTRIVAASAPAWLATAGAGDALGGILGALVATHGDDIAADSGALARLGATASVIHGLAAKRASAGGPFTIVDLIRAVPATIADLLR
ncbi:ADP-dependent NAD(P)H-hydrate dehydratase [Lacisediminihabitans changchengi]|uniref:ADP-dependent (S)-NAD(P)H-hydrate dehydratase n=1 Tax=Lacisediminihabitans changchengi TaxID=2787634 RepID=A0A934SSQ2_9MICO|nr:ADP/ATP-dependent (S)-NAD(P)H-hydrate dehydratase [Lacisediminihabitans changchengi]MBK4347429.1 NAD(P)H-hydrate dehydratase [Lacisediminihabitans changchengi]